MKSISRRDFLSKSGLLAGATYPALIALGALKPAPAHAFELEGSGKGKKVIILGAGLAGMATAYELGKLGYDCVILEARERSGGRCWSVKNGSLHTEKDRPTVTAKFDEGLYFNAGPSRIPHNHALTLHYCKELGVNIQVYNNVNESTYFFSEGKGKLANKKIPSREIHNDIRGYMAEMLTKTMDHAKLDEPLTKEDGQKIIEYLMAEGGLDADKLYKASARRGYIEQPGAGEKIGKIAEPHRLADIISSGLMDPDFYNVAEYTYELQMTMFQAVGGMDKIAQAFEKKVAPMLKLGAEVLSILNTNDGAKITYKDKIGVHEITGDFCVCTLPLPVLSNISNNFSSDVNRAIDYIEYNKTGKIGLQFKRRFWEEDEHIYGGITHTNNELTQIFYPSYDYLRQKGILIGYYNFNEKAAKVGELSYVDREKLALTKGRIIHPQYDKEFERSFSVSWHKTKYNMGGWAVYTSETRKNAYTTLIKPEQNIYFAGEHLTYLNAWMAGALESARSVVANLHSRATASRNAYQNETKQRYPHKLKTMANSINRRSWIKSTAIMAGATTFLSGAFTKISAMPKTIVENVMKDRFADQQAVMRAQPAMKARLSANENPFGPSKSAKKAMRKALDTSYQYPFMHMRDLTGKIAEYEGIQQNNILMDAGSSPILLAASLFFAKTGGEIISADPSYNDLPADAEKHGAKWVKVPLTSEYKIDLEAMEAKITDKTALIYICNPNNPTATLLDTAKLKAFCERVSKKVPVFIDEAYIDYLPDPQSATMIDAVKKGQNVIVARTFSKLYGFAGLRCGYIIALPETVKSISAFSTGMMSLSAPTLMAAIAAYQEKDFLTDALKKTMESKEFLYSLLKEEGYEYIPSSANFVMFPLKMQGFKFAQEMSKRGVSIRTWKFSDKEWCRVSIGRMDEMKAFAAAFKEIS